MSVIDYKKRIIWVYVFFIMYICVNDFLSPFISNTTIIRSTELVCLTAAVAFIPKTVDFRNKIRSSWLIMLLLLYSIYIIFRGEWNLGAKDMFLKLVAPETAVYLMPFIALLPNYTNFDKVINLFYKFSLLAIPLFILYSDKLDQAYSEKAYKVGDIGKYLPFFCAFLLLFIDRLSKWQKVFVWAIYLFYFYIMAMNGRRTICFILLIYFLFHFYIKLKEAKKGKSTFYTFSLCIVIAALLMNFKDVMTDMFPFMAERGLEDSRSSVNDSFLMDFYNASETDWIYGRGIDGKYQQLVTDKTGELYLYDRDGIETGALNSILKGGLIYLCLQLAIVLTSLIRGLFSKNTIQRNCAYVLILYLITVMSSSFFATFNVRSIIFWFCIGICNYKSDKKNKIT